MNVHLSLYSRNKKTGPIPVSTSPASTCPPTCPFKRKAGGPPAGCYGDNYPMLYHWGEVSTGNRGGSWASFLENVARFRSGQLWRANQAGDLPGDGTRIDAGKFLQLMKANEGRRGFTFTHYPLTDDNQVLIYLANAAGFTVNLSANNLAHADELAALDIGPVAVVLPHDQTENTTTPEGRAVVICPNHNNKAITCFNCGLCYEQARPIVGFPAHGSHKGLVNIIAKGE